MKKVQTQAQQKDLWTSDFLLNLPAEMFFLIIDYLSPYQLIALALTCKYLDDCIVGLSKELFLKKFSSTKLLSDQEEAIFEKPLALKYVYTKTMFFADKLQQSSSSFKDKVLGFVWYGCDKLLEILIQKKTEKGDHYLINELLFDYSTKLFAPTYKLNLGQLALLLAIEKNQISCAEVLCDKLSNMTETYGCCTPLHRCVIKDRPEILQKIINSPYYSANPEVLKKHMSRTLAPEITIYDFKIDKSIVTVTEKKTSEKKPGYEAFKTPLAMAQAKGYTACEAILNSINKTEAEITPFVPLIDALRAGHF